MDLSLDKVLFEPLKPLKRTKMVCTIGPTCDDVDTLHQLLRNGMNMCRMNFSHGDHEGHKQKLTKIREALATDPSFEDCAIILDTKGAEIRTGLLEVPNVPLNAGDDVIVTTDYSFKGNNKKFAISYPDLLDSVDVGSDILIADSNLTLTVSEINKPKGELKARIGNDFVLGEKKNVSLPGVKIHLPTIGEKDVHDIVNFGVKYDVDIIALSFTKSPDCIRQCRDLLGQKGSHIRIVAKIENFDGLTNLEHIVKAADGIMIDRGDLSMAIEISKVFTAQKYITQVARAHRKPIIIATQMLESMTKNSRPTKAEITDIGNAVFDLNDCVMLSGETGNGLFPLESCKTMTQICKEAELNFNYHEYFQSQKHKAGNHVEALGLAAVQLAFSTNADAIFCFSEDDALVKYMSYLRPSTPIIYPHFNRRTIRALQPYYGVITVSVDKLDYNNNNNLVSKCLERAKALELMENGKGVIMVDSKEFRVSILNKDIGN